jgi:hypothetical protein
MPIKGGIISSDNQVELSINIKGGRSYKRIYTEEVTLAINRFSTMISSIAKESNDKFCIDQAKILMEWAHIEIIEGEQPFQYQYNAWLIDGYVRMLLQSADLKMIAELLHLDSMIYAIEEASAKQDEHIMIEFSIPKMLSITKPNNNIKISMPSSNDLKAYTTSIKSNLSILDKFIKENKEALIEIHKTIINTASKYVSS